MSAAAGCRAEWLCRNVLITDVSIFAGKKPHSTKREVTESVFDYDVFFSYRHKPLDAEITQKTFHALEGYRLPAALRKRGFPEIRRAFRDTEELPVSRILTDTIDKALHSTNCLVVVCSTDTPDSEWIDREVGVFIELGRADHIYPLLISGDPEHSFPPSLKLVPDIMDRVMDIRDSDSNIRKMLAKEESELLRVIAGVVGCRESELVREHKLRKTRRTAARSVAAAAVLAAVVGVSLSLMKLAQNYRDIKSLQEAASMRILNELTYGLPDHLTNVSGAYGRIAEILKQNTVDLEHVLSLSSDKATAAYESAANYEKLANASTVLGRYKEALEAQQIAIARYQDLSEQDVEESHAKLASAYNNLGILYHAAGHYAEAASAFEKAITELSPSADNRKQLASFYLNAGTNAIDSGDMALAEKSLNESISLLPDPGNEEELTTAVRAHLNYGILQYQGGRFPDAEEQLRASCALCEQLLESADSLQNRKLYVQAKGDLALVLSDSGNYDEADSVYADAIRMAEILAEDTENTESQRVLADLYNNLARSYKTRGENKAADAIYALAVDIYRSLSERTGSDRDRAEYAVKLINLGENAFKQADYERSRNCFEEGLKVYKSVLDGLGDLDRAQYLSWHSYYLLVCERDFAASLEDALAAYRLQPDSDLVEMILAYACLYNGYYEDADILFREVASIGRGEIDMMQQDLDSQEQAGLYSEHIPAVRDLLENMY